LRFRSSVDTEIRGPFGWFFRASGSNREKSPALDPTWNLSGISLNNSDLHAQGNITIQQFVNSLELDEKHLLFFLKSIRAPEPAPKKYSLDKYKTYTEVWQKLQAVRIFGDDLWKEASNENLVKFAGQLRMTREKVLQGEIFFDPDHYDELLRILNRFLNYRIGKEKLIDIYDLEDSLRNVPKSYIEEENSFIEEEINIQILRNQQYKLKYEKLLKSIGKSFRKQLSE